MVFQAYSLFPNMTAEQNVAYGLRVRKWKRRVRMARAAELLELVGLSHARDRYPHQLSGGMQQRVALARALAIEPSILLLDEPLSALDAKVRVQLREEIRRIQSEVGTTTLYVTHDQEEALSISDRVAVLNAGRIEQCAKPAEIYSDPSTSFVADFIGTISHLDVEVRDPERGEVQCGGVRLRVSPLYGRRPGDWATIMLRPEAIEVRADVPGTTPGDEGLTGDVLSHTFLGANTRMKIAVGDKQISADVPSAVADALPVGSRVRATFPPESARALAQDSPQRAPSAVPVAEPAGSTNG
jgi:putative spermidine/putrescine transport system ATP-binding protein